VIERYREGTGFEDSAGYARAVRAGDRILVSGTGDVAPDGRVAYPGDVYEQTRTSFARGIAAVERLGGRREDVVRTRVYLAPSADWRDAVRAHAELFDDVRPANTLLHVAGFVADGMLVEIELEAYAPQASADTRGG
jgi:enamine deaminase RidA (YjgF/YER057c/UK114 family)